MDITSQAASFTNNTLKKVGVESAGVQADARHIPLQSNSIDILFSGGVLHHSENIQQSINQIQRVLKPGVIAYVGLYSKSSFQFLSIQLKALFKGKFSSKEVAKFLNANTEEDWETENRKNPMTQLFSIRECKKMFHNYSQVIVRKGNFNWHLVLKFGNFLSRIPSLKKLEDSKLMKYLGGGVYIKAIK